jgi:hypothetical protein
MTAFWDVAPARSLVRIGQRFRGDGPDDVNSKHLRNVDQLLMEHSRRKPSSCSLQWKREMLQNY